MYIKQTVQRASGNPGTGIQPRDQLVLIDVDDILYMPEPDDKGVVIEDNIVLKANKYAYGIYMTQGTIEVTSAADGDTDNIGFKPSIKFNHPGNEQAVREFKVNSINRKFIVIVRYCSGKPSDLIGTVCNPCKLTPSYTGNNDSNINEMTFEQISKGDDIFIYKGTIPFEEPVATVTNGTVTVTAEGQYEVSGTSTVTISGGSHGKVITLVGNGGTDAATLSAGDDVMLREGKSWTAATGSQITLRAFGAGDGVVWIEQSRYTAV